MANWTSSVPTFKSNPRFWVKLGWAFPYPFTTTTSISFRYVGQILRLKIKINNSCVLKSETLTRWCLARGASPNGSCPAGDTIMSAAGAEASLAVLRLLVEHGGRVDGCDCVMQASMAHAHGAPGRLEVVKYLLDLGAPIDAFMWEGTQLVGHKLSYSLLVGSQTALHWAVKEGKVDMVQLLLSRGADRNLKNQEYARNCCRTPIEIAEQQGLTAIADMLRSPPQSGNQDQKI